MKSHLLPALGSLCLCASVAYSATLRGTVWHQNTRIQHAIVIVERDGSVVERQVTDAQGNFLFFNLAQRGYSVTATSEGYLPAKREVVFRMGQQEITVELFLELEPKEKRAGGPAAIDAAAAARDPESERLLEKAGKDVAAGHFDAAIQRLREGAQRRPSDWRFRQGLGLALLRAGRNEEAEKELQEALRLGGSARSAFYLATLYNDTKRYQEAEQAARRAVEADPDSWEALHELARAQLYEGQTEPAEASARRALKLRSKGFPQLYLTLANIYVTAQRYPEAAESFRKFLKEAPQHPQADRVRQVLQEMEAAGVLKAAGKR